MGNYKLKAAILERMRRQHWLIGRSTPPGDSADSGGRLRRFFRKFGPGLITGAADDDPSGIATYSQTGAQFGFGQLWLVVFLYPLMTAVQETCARIGVVTKQGITAVIRKQYGRAVVYPLVVLVLVANTINIGANIGAMAAATNLLLPIPFAVLVLGFALFILVAEIVISYRPFARILKWTLLSMLAYPLTVLLIDVPWREVISATFIPHIGSGYAFFYIFTAVVGTTISPYMFFWQASEEVEEEYAAHRYRRGASKSRIRDLRLDNAFGMFASQVVMWSIIVVTGTVLHGNGVTNIATAADAARALEPLVLGFTNAGLAAKAIFAIGVVGLGLISVPVLAGSAAYVAAEAFQWRHGLSRRLREAHGFYGVITLATIAGLMINFIGIDPIQALIITSVINAIVAIPLVWILIFISSNAAIMGNRTSGPLSLTLLWATFFVLVCSAGAMIYTGI